jgi:hypothetical protein
LGVAGSEEKIRQRSASHRGKHQAALNSSLAELVATD